MFADGVPEEPGIPPLQATCHTIRNSTAIHEKRPSMTSSNPPGDIGRRGSQLRLSGETPHLSFNAESQRKNCNAGQLQVLERPDRALRPGSGHCRLSRAYSCPYGIGTGGTAPFAYEKSQRPSTLRAKPLKLAWLTAVQKGLWVRGSMATLK